MIKNSVLVLSALLLCTGALTAQETHLIKIPASFSWPGSEASALRANKFSKDKIRLFIEALVNGFSPPAPTLVVGLEKKVITQHEPVILSFTIDNTSSKEADFELGYGYEKVDVKVTDPDGRVWPKPRHSPPQENESLEFREAVQAAPGKIDANSIVLNDWFSFDQVGTYHINVALPSSSNPPSTNMRTTETPLTLTVLSRDEASLASACAALVTRVENSKSAADADAAADALSKVDDAAAVPFLARAMNRKWFTSMMVAALARLNTPDAVNVLISASRSSDPETSALARAALVALGKPAPQPGQGSEWEVTSSSALRSADPRTVAARCRAPIRRLS